MTEGSHVVILVLPSLRLAEAAAMEVHAATTEGRFRTEAMAIVERRGSQLRFHHPGASAPLTSFAGGALLGGLGGLVFGAVLAPALVVGGAAAAVTALSERSISKDELRTVGEALGDGQAALFVLADRTGAGIVADETLSATSRVWVFELHPEDRAALADVAHQLTEDLAAGSGRSGDGVGPPDDRWPRTY